MNNDCLILYYVMECIKIRIYYYNIFMGGVGEKCGRFILKDYRIFGFLVVFKIRNFVMS